MKYDLETITRRKKINRMIKKILDIFLVILIYHIILVFVSCLNKIDEITMFGFKAYKITTQSMQPSINMGDVVITKKTEKEELKKGDIITFEIDGKNITHRIVEIQNDEYKTKGDNNNVEDEKCIPYYSIKGKCILIIPFLGKIIDLLNNQIVFLIIVLVILIILFFKLGIEEKKQIRRNKKSEEDAKRENQIY